MPSELHPQRRLLFLLPFAPRLDAVHGGSRVMAQLIGRLATRHRIALLYLRSPDEPPVDEILQEQCTLTEEVVRQGIGRSLAQQGARRVRLIASLLRGKPMWVTDWTVAAYGARVRALARMWQPDIVQVEYHVMGQYLPALTTCPAPRVLTEHEPGVRAAPYVQQCHPGLTRVLHYFDTLAWRRFERTLIREVQAVVVFTEADRQAVARLTRRTPLVRIPLGTALPKDPLDPYGRPPLSLLFVGNFLHPPNVDAAVRLGGTIFPRLRARFPELMLYLVGDHPPPQIRRVADEKVIVTGCVPDVTPYLDRAALVVVPLRLGGGMRVKVLEALAAGKAVVASSRASEGLNLVNGEQILLAENDQQFCDAITRLLADPKERASLGAHARAWACANLDWEDSLAAYEALYDCLIERSRAMQQTGESIYPESTDNR